MDVERIRQALAVVLEPGFFLERDEPTLLARMTRHNADAFPAAIATLAEAARLVVEAREVWWCEEHGSDGIPRLGQESDRCWKGEFVRHLDPAECVMVPARLLVPPKGET